MITLDDSELAKPVIVPLCLICKRVNEQDNPSTCEAFPGGIPKEILNGSFVHTKSFPGDRQLLFTPVTPEEK
jgi:hypothetical protein